MDTVNRKLGVARELANSRVSLTAVVLLAIVSLLIGYIVGGWIF